MDLMKVVLNRLSAKKNCKKKKETCWHLQAKSEQLAIVKADVTSKLWRLELGVEDLKQVLAQKKWDVKELRKKKKNQKN